MTNKKLPGGTRRPGSPASLKEPGAGGGCELEYDLLHLASSSNMLLRKRCRHGPCRLPFLLLLLMLGCVLLMVAVLLPPPHAPHPAVTAQATQRSPDAGYRLDFGESQEWVLEAEDEGQEYSPLEGLPPFISLREDQLLVAVASPRARRNKTQSRRGGSYRLIKQPSRRQDEEAPERDWAAEEEDGAASEDELTPRSLEEAFSARIPLQRALPEVRHPLCCCLPLLPLSGPTRDSLQSEATRGTGPSASPHYKTRPKSSS